MRWWFTPDVTSWTKTADEWIGLREKLWVIDPFGAYWLRKTPLAWRPSSRSKHSLSSLLDAAGTVSRSGVVAHGRPRKESFGDSCLASFTIRPSSKRSAASYLRLSWISQRLSSDVAEARRRVSSTIELTRDVLRAQEDRYDVELIRPFLRMLVFDAWIGNGDRHSANWAILVQSPLHGSVCRLAPMYDTAGCLLADLTDDTVERRFGPSLEDAAVQRYMEKCRSGFGDGAAVPGILHRDLLDRLRKWPEWPEIAPSLIAFFSESLSLVKDLLDEIPEDWLNERRKYLARRLLQARVIMLEGLVP